MNNNLCECINWVRADITNGYYKLGLSKDNVPLIPNHHPNCPKYNDSLIDVWKVTVDGVYCYVDNQQDACDCDDGNTIITKEKMHSEIFENLKEFDGF